MKLETIVLVGILGNIICLMITVIKIEQIIILLRGMLTVQSTNCTFDKFERKDEFLV